MGSGTARDPSETAVEPAGAHPASVPTGPQARALVREWLATAGEMLDDAKFLLQNGRSSRSVINRAYFSVVYAVRALLAAKGIDARQPDSMFARFEQIYVKTKALPGTVSEIVQAVFELRIDNDYALVVPSEAALAASVVTDAETFLGAATKCLSRLADADGNALEATS